MNDIDSVTKVESAGAGPVMARLIAKCLILACNRFFAHEAEKRCWRRGGWSALLGAAAAGGRGVVGGGAAGGERALGVDEVAVRVGDAAAGAGDAGVASDGDGVVDRWQVTEVPSAG
jgi:hypothetical protein